jgi:uncharacterized protein YcaQ
MEEAGEIILVKIKGLEKERYYTTEAKLNAASTKSDNLGVKILSPFDNSIIQRSRLKNIFGFDYTIECYVPEKKRVYGYFCLPVLAGNIFVARIDCKADRANEILIVKQAHFEKDFRATQKFKTGYNKALKEFAKFNGCSTITGVDL